ncbi:MAG: putative alpha-glucosidase [Sphingobacteriaceae bacterium]|nr:putative alpha-glucosidase [Sphingobacteriaceae bacterium]
MKLKGKAVSGRKQFFLFVLMQIFVFNSYGDAVKQVTVSSPDKKLQIKLDCAGKGISYAVLIDGKAVLEHSRMGLQFQGATWGEASTIADVDTRSNDSTWTNPLGKNSNVVDRYNEANIEFKESAGGKFAIILRAYNDGLAFRYVLPEDKSAALSTLTAEQTEFAFSGDYPCYSGNLPKNVFNGKHAYEWEYLPGKLSELKGGQVLGIPLLVQTPAAWVAIAEADLLDWSGMWLSKPANSSASTKVGVQLAPRLEDRGW